MDEIHSGSGTWAERERERASSKRSWVDLVTSILLAFLSFVHSMILPLTLFVLEMTDSGSEQDQ